MSLLDFNLTLEQKATFLHVAGGVVVGVVSGFMTKDPYQLESRAILAFMLGILALFYFITQKGFNLRGRETPEQKYGVKWYLSNGVYPYAAFWLLAWIAMYNI